MRLKWMTSKKVSLQYKAFFLIYLEFFNDNSNNVVRQNNTIELEWSSSYKDSDFNLKQLPTRIQKRCQDLEILELEYLSRGIKKGMKFHCLAKFEYFCICI